MPFESFVNSERCKTPEVCRYPVIRLRALLIQKDVKRGSYKYQHNMRLRALLIQKDIKPHCQQKYIDNV